MYKKRDKPIEKEPNKAIYYIAGYVESDIAEQMQAQKRYTGQTHSAILREALRFYFDNKNKD